MISRSTRVWIWAGATLAVLAFMASQVIQHGWGGCERPTQGEGAALAVIEERGFARPFGALNFDEPGEWKLVFRNRKARTVETSDKALMKRLQNMRCVCIKKETGTADDTFDIVKDGKVVYSSGYFHGDGGRYGLQNAEFGYLPPSLEDASTFTEILYAVPGKLRGVVSKPYRVPSGVH